jgi:hypothetical protein
MDQEYGASSLTTWQLQTPKQRSPGHDVEFHAP